MTPWKRARLLVAWLLGLYLANMYIKMGWIKLDPHGFWTAAFVRWGYPACLRVSVGWVEVLGGAMLIIPWTATMGAFAVARVMGAAWITRYLDGRYVDVAWISCYLLGLFCGSRMSGVSSGSGSEGKNEGGDQDGYGGDLSGSGSVPHTAETVASLNVTRHALSTIPANSRRGFSGLKTTPTPFSILRSHAEGPLLIIQHLDPEAPIKALASGLHDEFRAAW